MVLARRREPEEVGAADARVARAQVDRVDTQPVARARVEQLGVDRADLEAAPRKRRIRRGKSGQVSAAETMDEEEEDAATS